MQDRKEYLKAYRQAHKEYMKAWRESHKEQIKAWREAHKEDHKEYMKAYYQAHKKEKKAWRESHKEQANAYSMNYKKNDVNSFGQTKASIRNKSLRYLNKYGIKIPGYQIHHCSTYDDPTKFIYCSKEMHHLIHAYLRQHNIDADSDHYKYIKHLLDETVVKYNIID